MLDGVNYIRFLNILFALINLSRLMVDVEAKHEGREVTRDA